ncbi:MAG: hypothetical protein OXE40_00455 [Gammaproteobacteria bacterium]|nr:hypothetical protein [Gammaproteobacteria bacterium]
MDAETSMWSAAYVPYVVMVDLGTSGEQQELTRNEMGVWSTDPETAFNSGETVMSSSGNEYRLTYGEDGWGAMYVPRTMPIMGTMGPDGEPLTASANEDGSGYTIVGLDDQVLGENGLGSVMTPNGNCRVHMDEDGNLVGMQFEMAVDGDSGTPAGGTAVAVAVAPDEAMTDMNEAGTTIKIDGIDHNVGDLMQDGSSTVEGDNIVAGVLKDVSTLVAQIKGLIAVNKQEADNDQTPTSFVDSFNEKWHAIDVLLDTVFGENDTRTVPGPDDDPPVTELFNIDARPVTVDEMVEMLDEIVAALSDEDAFVAAVEDGVFESGRVAGNNANARSGNSIKAFNAVDSTATAYIAMTENTRFGISKKQTRTEADSALTGAAAGITTFAYSPMAAAKFADLPQVGAAEYNGRTMAISMDGKTIYNGDISLQVRFRGKRVSGLVENLMDGDGNLFEYGFGKVAAIILGEATISSDGDFTKDFERPSQIIFAAEPGQPQAQTLRDENGEDGTPGTEDDVIRSAFAGQFVGDGAAAIGTGGLTASTDDENLTAAFGAEKGADVPETAPTFEGGGESLTAIGATVNKTGVITLVTAAQNSNGGAITVKGADLFDSGGAETKEATYVADAIKAINSQLERLNAFIALDGLGDEASADAGRTSVWEELADAIQLIVGADGGNEGEQIFAAADYVTTATDDSDADAAAKEIIADVLAALGSNTAFRAAVKEGGALYGDGTLSLFTKEVDGTPTSLTANDDIDPIFNRVKSTTTVEFGSTRYTRFGAWNRQTWANAQANAETPSPGGNGVFAYSPLAATTYALSDPNFPGGGSATYEGTTIARATEVYTDPADTTDNPVLIAANTYFEGSITIGVEWMALPTTNDTAPDTVGTVTASINNLRTDAGVLYMNTVANEARGVDTIVLAGAVLNVQRAADGMLTFTGAQDSSRLRHTDIRITDGDADANLSGTFVGKVIDGPLGIIGSWDLENTNGANLVGAYGADLAP